MIQDELIYQIETHFGHMPTREQHVALQTFAAFMTDRDEQVLMVLLFLPLSRLIQRHLAMMLQMQLHQKMLRRCLEQLMTLQKRRSLRKLLVLI